MAELGKAQLKLELDFTLIKIYCIKLMTRLYQTYNGIEKWTEVRQKLALTM